jgi:hypothetical protein
MTPDEFLPRVLAAVDEAAFRLAYAPRGQQNDWLQGFAERLRAQWLEVFQPFLSGDDVDGMVGDVVSRIRAKRRGLEGVGAGTA